MSNGTGFQSYYKYSAQLLFMVILWIYVDTITDILNQRLVWIVFAGCFFSNPHITIIGLGSHHCDTIASQQNTLKADMVTL